MPHQTKNSQIPHFSNSPVNIYEKNAPKNLLLPRGIRTTQTLRGTNLHFWAIFGVLETTSRKKKRKNPSRVSVTR